MAKLHPPRPNLPPPSGNVEWSTIPKDADIIDGGSHFQYDGKTVYWGSQDAVAAQTFLAKRARITERKQAR
jgi:hypothetical protein